MHILGQSSRHISYLSTNYNQCQLTISAATPNKNVAKKAATDELGSAVKEPVAKKAKVKCLPPLLELSANTKAILRIPRAQLTVKNI